MTTNQNHAKWNRAVAVDVITANENIYSTTITKRRSSGCPDAQMIETAAKWFCNPSDGAADARKQQEVSDRVRLRARGCGACRAAFYG